MSGQTGIDIAWARPTIAEIKSTGATWVARYFSNDPTKNITAAEVRDYPASGLGIVTVWESTATRALAGFAAGQADARTAERQRASVGLPADHIHHFAVDTDTDWPSVNPYFDGVTSVIGKARTGVYGGLRVIDGAHSYGLRYLWQTVAWSGGVWSPYATIRQPGGTALNGAADYDTAEATDFGQYPRPAAPQPPAALILRGDDVPAGQLQPGFGVDPTGNITHPELASVVWLGGKNTGAVAGSWLALFCDFGTARVRVAIHSPSGWDVRTIDLDSSQGAVGVPNIANGATHASILRVDRSTATVPDTSASVPVGYGTVMEIK
jgi:hypothetical protein